MFPLGTKVYCPLTRVVRLLLTCWFSTPLLPQGITESFYWPQLSPERAVTPGWEGGGAIVLCKQACVTLLSYFSQNSEISSLPLLFTYLPLSSLLRQLSLSPAGASVVPRLFCLCLTRSGSAVFFLTFAHLVAESVRFVCFVCNCVKIVLCDPAGSSHNFSHFWRTCSEAGNISL